MSERTAEYVHEELIKRISKCFYLLNTAPREDIVSLDRSEIQVGKLLGTGGFSEVYEVTSIDGEEDEHDCLPTTNLVVKHLRQDLLAQRNRFQQAAADLAMEAEYLSRLQHPHIAQIHGWSASGIRSFGEGHDSFFLLLDRYDGTLTDRINTWNQESTQSSEASLSHIPHFELKLRYAQQIASALDYLHSHRLLYRDLKPDNIGIRNGSIQLFDFGLCRELPQQTEDDGLFCMSGVGTWRYMAPEVVLHQRYNQKADVFSFGMVLYELFFHQKPFELYNFDMHKLLVCEGGKRPNLPQSCPIALDDVLQGIWRADPGQRSSIAEVQAGLNKLASFHRSTSHSAWSRLLNFWGSMRVPHRPMAQPTTTTTTTSALKNMILDMTSLTVGNTSSVEEGN